MVVYTRRQLLNKPLLQISMQRHKLCQKHCWHCQSNLFMHPTCDHVNKHQQMNKRRCLPLVLSTCELSAISQPMATQLMEQHQLIFIFYSIVTFSKIKNVNDFTVIKLFYTIIYQYSQFLFCIFHSITSCMHVVLFSD